MKTMSISIDEELYEKLKHSVPNKKISMFVSKVISNALEIEERELRLAYVASENDSARQEELRDWDAIDVDY